MFRKFVEGLTAVRIQSLAIILFHRKLCKKIQQVQHSFQFIVLQNKYYSFGISLQFSTEIRNQGVHMLQQFFKSANKSSKATIQLPKKENLCKPIKANKTLQYVNDRLQTDSTEVEPLKLKQNFDLSNNLFSTLRKPRKFQRKSTLNSSKVNKSTSFTQRISNCEQYTVNQVKQKDEKENREHQRSGNILFPKRETKYLEASLGKKKHLVRTARGFPVTPIQEELKSICRQSSDEIGNIKPLRMCMQEFIYCTGKRVKYIPISSILGTPQSYGKKSQNQIPTQSTISNFRQLGIEKRKSFMMGF